MHAGRLFPRMKAEEVGSPMKMATQRVKTFTDVCVPADGWEPQQQVLCHKV